MHDKLPRLQRRTRKHGPKNSHIQSPLHGRIGLQHVRRLPIGVSLSRAHLIRRVAPIHSRAAPGAVLASVRLGQMLRRHGNHGCQGVLEHVLPLPRRQLLTVVLARQLLGREFLLVDGAGSVDARDPGEVIERDGMPVLTDDLEDGGREVSRCQLRW